jgi:hypothetical protein
MMVRKTHRDTAASRPSRRRGPMLVVSYLTGSTAGIENLAGRWK